MRGSLSMGPGLGVCYAILVQEDPKLGNLGNLQGFYRTLHQPQHAVRKFETKKSKWSPSLAQRGAVEICRRSCMSTRPRCQKFMGTRHFAYRSFAESEHQQCSKHAFRPKF